MSGLATFVTALAGVVILWFGGHRVISGALTVGQLSVLGGGAQCLVGKQTLSTAAIDRLANVTGDRDTGFVLAGIAFSHVMGPFRWLRDHYVEIRTVSGALLVAIGLLLFFDRIWWLSVGFNRALEAVGLH